MSFDLGGEGNSFAFDEIGAKVEGTIVSINEVQQSDMQTGEPAFWDAEKKQPKKMFHVVLQTALRTDDADDGQRSVYLRGSKKPESQSSLAAVLIAVREATGRTALDEGATLALKYTGDGVQSKKGFNAPKLYAAKYAAKVVDLDEGKPDTAAAPF